MNRLDRLFGILLHLRSGKTVTATALAEAFEVSTRTIYRDVDDLSALGVPVYAERGREGGFRLLEGYFLPPITFSRDEAISLILALTLLRSLPSRPFAAALEAAETRLLAALPDRTREVLAAASRVIGFEATPADIFHREPADTVSDADEGGAATVFLTAILERRGVRLRYRSPYSARDGLILAYPLGVLWDRGHWYLAGVADVLSRSPRLWRADRMAEIALSDPLTTPVVDFEVGQLLGRAWLKEAMASWRRSAPVKIRLAPAQADLLRRDWYFRHADYADQPDGQVVMTFGEDDPRVVLDLVHWLGVGAELIAPRAWRDLLRAELETLIAAYQP